MKLDYIFISFLAFLSVPACYGDLQESQKEELYYFLKENRERLPIALFLQKMYDLQINETARERMIQEMIPLWDEKNRKSQDLVNVIAKTLLKDYAPLGKRTYSQYQGLENQPVPEWLDMDEGDDVIALENKSDKNLPKSNHEEKEEQKEENSLFKNRQVNKIQEVTELMENMIYALAFYPETKTK